MTEYTPITAEVRGAYRAWSDGQGDSYAAKPTWSGEEFDRWLAQYRESVIDEVEDHLVLRDQFTERTLTVIDELRKDYSAS